MSTFRDRAPGLDKVIAAKTEALVRAAESAGRVTDTIALAELERLTRLAQLRKPRRSIDWLSAGLVVSLFLILCIPYAMRVELTSVSAEVAAEEVAFELGARQPVLAGERLSYLSLSGLDSVVLPVDETRATTIRTRSILLRFDTAQGKIPTIDLAESDLAEGTLIRIRSTGIPYRYAWDLDHRDRHWRRFEHQVSISGPVIAVVNRQSIRLGHEIGARLIAYSSSRTVVMTEYADSTLRTLDPIHVARQLTFDRTYPFQETERAVSMIRGGAIMFEDLNGREIRLGPGQALRFDTVDVEVPYFALEPNQIRLRFSGEAGGMRTGTRGQRNLMPRWLEYIKLHPAVVLISSAGLTLIGYLIGVLGWWRRSGS